MRSLCQSEWQAREAVLKLVSGLDYSVNERLAALGLTPYGIAKVRSLTSWRDDHSTPAALEDVSPWFRVGVMRVDARGGSSGTPIGAINGWTVLVWTY